LARLLPKISKPLEPSTWDGLNGPLLFSSFRRSVRGASGALSSSSQEHDYDTWRNLATHGVRPGSRGLSDLSGGIGRTIPQPQIGASGTAARRPFTYLPTSQPKVTERAGGATSSGSGGKPANQGGFARHQGLPHELLSRPSRSAAVSSPYRLSLTPTHPARGAPTPTKRGSL
jgi:hypothetical protein